MKAADFIGQLFLARDVAHSVHLNTRSFAKHMALNTFYEEIIELADGLAEAYQGRHGLLGPITLQSAKKTANITDFLAAQMEELETERYNVFEKSDTPIQNLIDGIIELYLSTLYKLRFFVMTPFDSQTKFGKIEDFDLQVARGQIAGHSTLNIYGYQPAVATSFIPVWENATTYTFPIVAAKMHLAGSVGDTASISISGLDANYVAISEVLVLNGATAVTTVNSYLRINGMQVTVGSATNPSGVVTLKDLTDTTIYAQINTGVGRTQAAIYTVPAGFTYYLSRIDVNTSLNGSNFATYQNKTVSPTGVVQLTQQAPFAINYHTQRVMPRAFIEKTDLQLQCKVNATTGAISISQEGYLIKNYQG